MKDLLVAAREVQSFLDQNGWHSCIIGGIAVQRWGEPRLTRDVDVTLVTGLGQEESYVDRMLGRFASRIPEARTFALTRRVMLLATDDGTPVDLALGGLPFEARAVDRASDFEFYPGMTLRTCSAEDLLVMKAFAGRERDWGDVKGVVARQGSALDWDLVFLEVTPLCELKESPENVAQLQRIRQEFPSV